MVSVVMRFIGYYLVIIRIKPVGDLMCSSDYMEEIFGATFGPNAECPDGYSLFGWKFKKVF